MFLGRNAVRTACVLLVAFGGGCSSDGSGDDLPPGAFTSGGDDDDGVATEQPPTTGVATDGASVSETADDSTGFGMVSYAESIQPLWPATCFGSLCHDAATPGGALNLSPDGPTDPYTELTTRSHALSGMPYVTPGEPQASYLFRKLEGTHATGDLENVGGGGRMPLGLQPLDDATMALIEAWIVGGAMP